MIRLFQTAAFIFIIGSSQYILTEGNVQTLLDEAINSVPWKTVDELHAYLKCTIANIGKGKNKGMDIIATFLKYGLKGVESRDGSLKSTLKGLKKACEPYLTEEVVRLCINVGLPYFDSFKFPMLKCLLMTKNFKMDNHLLKVGQELFTMFAKEF